MLINSLLTWVAIVTLLFLVLGVYRQLALLMPQHERVVADWTGSPRVGERVPKEALAQIRKTTGEVAGSTKVIFVTEGCVGCRRLVSDATSSGADGAVFVTKDSSPEFLEALSGVQSLGILTDDGSLWESFGVSATPLVVQVSQDGRVDAKEVTHEFAQVGT